MSSKWLGVDHESYWGPPITEALFDLVQSAKANCFREHTQIQLWLTNEDYFAHGKYQDALKNTLMAWTKARNIHVILAPMGYFTWGDRNEKASIIVNENGLGDLYIDALVDMVRKLSPSAIHILNEAPAVGYTQFSGVYTPAQWFSLYRDFVVKAVNRLVAVKPDILCHVGSAPYYEPLLLLDNPIPRNNIVYVIHTYYFDYYSNGAVNADSGSWSPRYYNGDLIQAKLDLEADLLSVVSRFKAANLPLVIEEAGAKSTLPNYLVFMYDLYDICRRHTLGIIHHSFTTDPPIPFGLFNQQYQLNDMGNLWFAESSKEPSTPTPPTVSNILLPLAVLTGAIIIGLVLKRKGEKK